MTSPSPPSSPLGHEISPPSSPIILLSPPKKRRSWQVYSKTENNTNTQPAKSTSWRWKKLFREEKEPAELPDDCCPHNDEQEQYAEGDEITTDTTPAENQREAIFTGGIETTFDAPPAEDLSEALRYDSFDSVESRESDFPPDIQSESSSDSSDVIIESSEESVVDNESVASDVSSADSSDMNQSLSDEEQELRPLYDDCKFSVDEAIFDILSDHIESHGTINSLKSHLKTFLKYVPKPNSLPKNTNQLFDYVLNLVPSYIEKASYYCSKCFLFAENKEIVCRACNNEAYNCFYTFSLEEQIRFYFEECNLANILDKYRDKMHSKDGKIRDITDGSEYKRVSVNGRYSLTLLMNTDGVAIRKSGHTSIWPVMFSICEIPSYLRQRYMMVSAIWCDRVDPPMNTFLKPLVEELRNIHNNGGVSWVHPETKVEVISEVYCPVICADAPARAKVQNILSHGGNRSCNTCEQKRRRIALTPQEVNLKAAGKKVMRRRAFAFQEDQARLRTDTQMRRQARTAADLPPNKTARGIKGPTVVALIPKLDISTCVYAEYMHGVCLGVTRQFLTLWFSESGIWSHKQGEVDMFIKNIAPTSDIGRLLRGTKDLKVWKASEFRAWLLYVSLPCIFDKLPPPYVQHWTLLVKAVFLLLREEISEQDLVIAETMLRMFVRDIAHLYGYKAYSYNVHQLLHLPLYVRRWGNLWSISAFKFENYNGILVHLVHGTKNPAKELMKNLRIAHGLEILRNRVHGKFVALSQNCIELLNIQCIGKAPNADQTYLKDNFPEIHQIYLRAVKNKVIFTSKLYGRERKRNNYTVKFKTPTISGYGEIKYFLMSGENNCAVLEKFKIMHTAMFTHNASGVRVDHIVPIDVRLPRDILVVNVEEIMMKVIRVGDFVCCVPNKYERHNL